VTTAHHRVFAVVQTADVGHARRAVVELGRRLGFSEDDAGKAAIVATELGTNLVKHATGGGDILVRPLFGETPGGLELISVDRGPGIKDPGQALQNGYTTGTSPGIGLGAVRRLSRVFDIYTQVGKGTVVLSQLWSGGPRPGRARAFQIGAVMVPYPGLDVCGDGWGMTCLDSAVQVLVVDGVGHGRRAAEAGLAALQAYITHAHSPLPELMQLEHEALRDTRGAVLAVARIEREPRKVHYVGFGDISGRVVSSGTSLSCVSKTGIVGAKIPSPQVYTYKWEPTSLLIMHSDGLTSRWDVSAYPGLDARHPTVIAAVLYRDHKRSNDDVTVVTVREGSGVHA
jgi:anti-sigma regulatory factor (Ser/Thr protein kinase)